ncbi:ATP-binding protein [Tunicatimonas pelagia]|uniref:ATP-binding protein n=1 Tax=Tunicatimonas pelagia TaxID=931531 RepID=UPI0026668991|nr:ATP-binding protein [Tunicatimonas pelagia]WKN43499.1 ATP-binding protein [Tunicatimonas pelagia]
MKFRIVAFLIILPLFGNLSAQNYQQIDSLHTALEAAEDDHVWNIYNEIGWAYRLSYPDSTIYYSRLVLNSVASSHQKAKALNFQGIALVYKGNYADAFASHRQALDTAQHAQDSIQLAYSYNNLGRLLLSQGDRLKAHTYINQALAIFKDLDDKTGVAYCYKSLVQLYTLQNDTTRMLALLHEALKIRQEIDDIRGQISTYQELAAFYQEGGPYNKAYHYLQIAMGLSQQIKDEMTIAEINLSLANLAYGQTDYSRSMQYLRRAISATDVFENVRFISSVNLLLAKNYYARRQYNKARLYLQDIVDNSTENGLKQKKEAYYYLAKINEMNGEHALALKRYQQFVAAKDSLYNVDKAITVERLENRLRIEEKEKEYELLKADEARNREVLEQARIKIAAKNIILLLVFLLLLTLLAFYYRVRQKNRFLEQQQRQIEEQNEKIISQNTQIIQQNKELSEKNARLEEIGDERETLMSMVTHDLKAPFQRISGLAEILTMNLSVDPSETKKYINLIKNTSQSGSSLVNNLLNNSLIEKQDKLNLEEVNLSSLLGQLLNSFENEAISKSIALHLNVESSTTLETDPLVLGQIITNLVSNAIKYAPNGSNVHLLATTESQKVIHISVKDEGPGFSDEDKRNLYQKFKKLSARPTNGESSHGLGLSIVKVLSIRLQASIELISEPNRGSEFIITFPKSYPQPNAVSQAAPNII